MKVFADTMIYLHYKSPDQIDWQTLCDAENVAIVIPRITIRELDKHKNTHSSNKIRERARLVLKKIERWLAEGNEIRKGVKVEYYPPTPKIEFEKYDLDPNWNDDHLIASAIQYMSDFPSETVVLVTQDSGPKMTANHVGLNVLELPQEYKLPSDPDPLEIENRRLQQQLNRVQRALPQMVVCFIGQDEPSEYATFILSKPIEINEDAIKSKIDELTMKYPKQCPPTMPRGTIPGTSENLHSSLGIYSAFSMTEEKEYERYNNEVDSYLKKCRCFLQEELPMFENFSRRTIQFEIAIINNGTAPADDVGIEIHFPDGFQLFSEDELPKKPKPPKIPQKPRTFEEIMQGSLKQIVNFPSPIIPNFDLSPPSAFKIKKTSSYIVSDEYGRIKHGYQIVLPKIYLSFNSYEMATSFRCSYVVTAANLPDPTNGELHFVIEKNEAD